MRFISAKQAIREATEYGNTKKEGQGGMLNTSAIISNGLEAGKVLAKMDSYKGTLSAWLYVGYGVMPPKKYVETVLSSQWAQFIRANPELVTSRTKLLHLLNAQQYLLGNSINVRISGIKPYTHAFIEQRIKCGQRNLGRYKEYIDQLDDILQRWSDKVMPDFQHWVNQQIDAHAA